VRPTRRGAINKAAPKGPERKRGAPRDFEGVFRRLKGILAPYAGDLAVQADKPGAYSMAGRARDDKETWFGAATVRKNYVSFHLMPVYSHPQLLKGISPELKRRMQGKSCFNFTAVDENLLGELERLTENGFKTYRKEGLV
jgi:hypothetical protein